MLTSRGSQAVEQRASDALRRWALAEPIPILSGSAEAQLIRHAETASRRAPTGRSVVKDALGLKEYVLAPIVPESQVVAVLVVDRERGTVDTETRAAVDLDAHLVGK